MTSNGGAKTHPLSTVEDGCTYKISFLKVRAGPLPPSKGFRYIRTIVDRFSRWPEAIPLPDITAQSVVDVFVLHFVGCYGAMETISIDRGRNLYSLAPLLTSTLWHLYSPLFSGMT